MLAVAVHDAVVGGMSRLFRTWYAPARGSGTQSWVAPRHHRQAQYGAIIPVIVPIKLCVAS